MSSGAADSDVTWWVRAARWVAFVIAFVAGLAVTVVVVRLAADGIEPWASWRAATRYDGFPVLVAGAAWLVLGVLLQAPVALLRRAQPTRVWVPITVSSASRSASAEPGSTV